MTKMTLEIRVHELEERLNGAGDHQASSTTPKSDRKLNKVYGIFGKFYGKDKHPGESKTRCHLPTIEIDIKTHFWWSKTSKDIPAYFLIFPVFPDYCKRQKILSYFKMHTHFFSAAAADAQTANASFLNSIISGLFHYSTF